jgi:hypothetical protein
VFGRTDTVELRCLGQRKCFGPTLNAIRSDDWAIPHVGLSSLTGEIVVWARPEFSAKEHADEQGLRALGYNVRIGV